MFKHLQHACMKMHRIRAHHFHKQIQINVAHVVVAWGQRFPYPKRVYKYMHIFHSLKHLRCSEDGCTFGNQIGLVADTKAPMHESIKHLEDIKAHIQLIQLKISQHAMNHRGRLIDIHGHCVFRMHRHSLVMSIQSSSVLPPLFIAFPCVYIR